MPPANDKNKYRPLQDFLSALPRTTNESTLTFEEIEQIIGNGLPPSAGSYREWWANQEAGSRAPYWRTAGFKVDQVDLSQRVVRFKRMSQQNDVPGSYTLQEVITAVNERASGRDFGHLPAWRRDHKGKKSLPETPFYSGVDADRGYVFHVGGLSELQFNLGFEVVHDVNTFRHGVAFSLQTTRDLPTIEPLVPKVARFNEYLHTYPEDFVGFEMWHWSDGLRSDNYPVSLIPDHQVKPRSFIFLGRLQSPSSIQLGLILNDFDRLLPLYEYVEGTAKFPAQAPASERGGFVWSPGNKSRITETTFERPSHTVDRSLRHNAIQPALYEYLRSIHGENVSGEQPTANGTYIDVVVHQDDGYTYYEIKTGLSAQSCIRDAIGQLLEYSCWPDAQSATRLIVVGEPPLDKEARFYLETLQKKFSMPLEYRQFNMTSRTLVA